MKVNRNILTLMDELQAAAARMERDRLRENELVAAMLTGSEYVMLGKRVRIRVEWLDGLPYGMTADELRRWGEDLKSQGSGPR